MIIGRTRICDEILVEFCVPKRRTSNKAIIFCMGMPGSPDKDEIMEFFARKGYWCFFPRYRGSWESFGSFLNVSPEQDILDVVSHIKGTWNDLWTNDEYKCQADQIYIIGTSFGGPAAILASRDSRVKKSIAISPVIDWQYPTPEEPLDELYDFSQQAYGPVYRIKRSDWDKLEQGNFYNPIKHTNEIDGQKVWIIQAQDDQICPVEPCRIFVEQTQCKFTLFKRGGHLSSELLMSNRYFNILQKFFSN